MYRLFVPPQAVGANLVYLDLFNATDTGNALEIQSVVPVVIGSADVVTALAVDLYLTRTSAIGTGGTEATQDGSSLTAATITCASGSQPCPKSITARLTPTGGATAGAVLSFCSLFTEETNAGTYAQWAELVTWGMTNVLPIRVPMNTGLRIVQGSVASAGSIGFLVAFRVVN